MHDRRAGLLLFGALCAACAGPPGPAGAYRLTALDGRSLPTQMAADTCAGRLLSGGLTLGADSTWRGTLIGWEPCEAVTDTSVYAGRYTAAGTTLTLSVDGFTWGGAFRTSGSVVDSLTGVMRGSGLTLVYAGAFGGEKPVTFTLQRVP